eukprot:TRINITY_DN3662_c0_g1_i3.p1 TRINITY_DN3662_c0_g1~~TRINITY_DN3662_c0_g1_i3.p1  ORF type:complete len:749 (-),score=116.47 TRINITY_DN3662_c0_g1_i3:346-2592(-)
MITSPGADYSCLMWLHSVHRGSNKSASSVQTGTDLLPWTDTVDLASYKRIDILQHLLERAAEGKQICVVENELRDIVPRSFSSTSSAAESVLPSKGDELPISILDGALEIREKNDNFPILQIPLLLSDIAVEKVRLKHSDSSLPEYILAVATRPSQSRLDAFASSDQEQPLDAVWFICVGGFCTQGQMEALFNELGCRGALRWDLHDCFEVGTDPLGVGACAKVFLGRKRFNHNEGLEQLGEEDDSHEEVAVKYLHPRRLQKDNGAVLDEIQFLIEARGHPNITQLFGVYSSWEQREGGRVETVMSSGEEPEGYDCRLRWSLVMELCPAGDLHDLLAAHGALDVEACLEVVCGTLSGIAYLHHISVVHRDVKAENILLGRDSRPVLADLGIAAHLWDDEAMSTRVGSPGYISPEVAMGMPYNEKFDVFSCGVVLYFTLSNRRPFRSAKLNEMLKQTAQCKIKYAEPVFQQVSGGVLRLLRAMLSKEPHERPSSYVAFCSAWQLLPDDMKEGPSLQASYQSIPRPDSKRKKAQLEVRRRLHQQAMREKERQPAKEEAAKALLEGGSVNIFARSASDATGEKKSETDAVKSSSLREAKLHDQSFTPTESPESRNNSKEKRSASSVWKSDKLPKVITTKADEKAKDHLVQASSSDAPSAYRFRSMLRYSAPSGAPSGSESSGTQGCNNGNALVPVPPPSPLPVSDAGEEQTDSSGGRNRTQWLSPFTRRLAPMLQRSNQSSSVGEKLSRRS